MKFDFFLKFFYLSIEAKSVKITGKKRKRKGE